MTVATLSILLEILPDSRRLIVQDQDGDAVLEINGVWIPLDPQEPIQLTTKEA